ncbi:MAG: D-alanyl-D-alanine carboxypeptidase [Desulfobacterales bacterium]
MTHRFHVLPLWLFFGLIFVFPMAGSGADLAGRIGAKDAVCIQAPDGRMIFSKNADIPLVPASILKILTSLAAIDALGPEFQFTTEFYLDAESNLWIKGYGDPLLVSETVGNIVGSLSGCIRSYQNLFLDDSHFESAVVIPGVGNSLEPYDAPNGALCVNFNTINFKRTPAGVYVSAEPQTPLLTWALPRIRKSGLREGRIPLPTRSHDAARYAGQLFAFFLGRNGVSASGMVEPKSPVPDDARLVYTYQSPLSLTDLTAQLMEFSNNFIANQLILAAGAEAFGPPASLEKGVRLLKGYAQEKLDIRNLQVSEGSGLSRNNRISARQMLKILSAFSPNYHLMRQKNGMYFKTGTLKDVQTRAGYVPDEAGRLYLFVAMVNTPSKSVDPILESVRTLIQSHRQNSETVGWIGAAGD